eukprot:Ihof_evm1s423 gene=Ihof_evmTU1s423
MSVKKEGHDNAGGKRKHSGSASGSLKKVKQEVLSESDDDALVSTLKAVKKEPREDRREVKRAREPMTDSDDEPLESLKKAKSPPKKKPANDTDSEDEPLSALKRTVKKPIKKELSDSDDEPISSLKGAVKKPIKKKDIDSDDEPISNLKKTVKKEAGTTGVKPVIKKATANKIKKEDAKPVTKKALDKKIKTEEDAIKAERKEKAAKKKAEEEMEAYDWWNQEQDLEEGQRWKHLEHNCPLLAPPYVPLPNHVKFIYDGKPVDLSLLSEEVAGYYAAMIRTDYATKDIFLDNFFKDWRDNFMTPQEKKLITDWKKCDFSKMVEYFDERTAIRKAMTKEEKNAKKEERELLIKEYGWATVDGHKERVANFMVEPPGLFRGRGEHPKMGMIKKRITASDIIINIGKDAVVPTPPEGQTWKKIIHDDHVTWLCSWTENICGNIKYIMLNAQSRMKGENDMKKYEKARKLKDVIGKIRASYTEDLKSKETVIRQRATALYFIDKLALRVGNEKDTDEEADTVGCCSLRVEHVQAIEPDQVAFDFLGKDSIQYKNQVQVIAQVYKNVKLFRKGKEEEHMLFDRLSVTALNKYLQNLMEGLTAKVFRTYNASITLKEQLNLVNPKNMSEAELLLAYNRANRSVAVLCNHQRAVPKTHDVSMGKLITQLEEMKEQYKTLKEELKKAKAAKDGTEAKLDKKVKAMKERIKKKEIAKTDRDENKTIALGTSKINYMDPRITIA